MQLGTSSGAQSYELGSECTRARVHTHTQTIYFCENTVPGIFVDAMKVFDTVHHNRLLSHLYNTGFKGAAHKWFHSGRTHVLKVNRAVSDVVTVQYDILQESVLSGPLFLIYVNNLCEDTFKANLVAFSENRLVL